MKEAQEILRRTLRKWWFIRCAEIVLLALAVGVTAYFLFAKFWVSSICFLGALLVGFWYVRPWNYKLDKLCSYVDETIAPMEHSTALLIAQEEQLTLLSKIQQLRASKNLQKHKGDIRIGNALLPIIGISAVCILAAWGLYSLGVLQKNQHPTEIPKSDLVNFKNLDSIDTKVIPPKILDQEIRIQYPNYTKKGDVYTTQMNLKVLEGSRVSWNMQFDQVLNGAQLQLGEDSLQMEKNKNSYSKSIVAEYANFYAIKFEDSLGNGYLSDLYALETYSDDPPVIEMVGLQQFSTFEFDGPQKLSFIANLKDDFGLTDVAIIATVSKGTGESVKFREERLGFDSKLNQGTINQSFNKSLNLKELKMEPGDELYFYVEAKDNKRPRPNITRTETFFSVIKDTVTNQFAVEGTLGADLMPDYFRSQRQLIIDTEKLISDEPTIEKKEFNFRSNELGFDQKALRIKYGEFMGDESEGGPVVTEVQQAAASDDPLAEYTHDHDGDNEHNLVAEEHDDHDHGESPTENDGEDPLEAYVHNHEDPEASTLFAQSLKSKLKQAMAEMWDAELYLRLFQPEKSLPYQYKALKLIQEIKNSARIYVHRIGFDPPPIKEDKRLTGDLNEIGNYSKREVTKKEEKYANMRKAVARLETLINSKEKLSKQDRQLFAEAGNELGRLAIAEPGKYLKTLQSIKWLSQAEEIDINQLETALNGLYVALPKKEVSPNSDGRYDSQLNNLFIEFLDVE